jgi:hypothetical protein
VTLARWQWKAPSRLVAAVLILNLLWVGQFALVSPRTGGITAGPGDAGLAFPLLDAGPSPGSAGPLIAPAWPAGLHAPADDPARVPAPPARARSPRAPPPA